MSPLAIIFLSFGLWLHQWIRAQEVTLPRPSLWADPGPLVPQKKSVILRCRGFPGAEKYRLTRGGFQDRDVSTAGTEAEFPISSVTPDTVGHYRCLYMNQSHWSKPSEPVELVMTDWYDKPFLSALPSPEVVSGENVTLHCRSKQWFEKYALHKEGGAISQSQGSWYHADFLIPMVKAAHGGLYRCYSFHREAPYEWSAPSDPLELRVSGSLSKPSLYANPGALMPKGELVTFWCQGPSEALGYKLEKEGTQWSAQSSCQYDKPVLSAKPSSVVVPGENVTLHCNSAYGLDSFMMSKDQVDEVTPPKPWMTQANFSIRAVKAADGGTYRCYTFDSYSPYDWSVPSDPLVLRVTVTGTTMTPTLLFLLYLGLSLGQRMRTQAAGTFPKPSLRVENGSLVPQGRTVTLRCRGSQEADLYRLEQKLGNARSDVKDMTIFGMEAKFSFPFVSWNHAGNYYCHYRHSLGWSEPSDPLELVVTGVYKEPSLAALPSSEVALGQNVTLQCQSQRWLDWCVLYKDGEEISRGRTRSHEGGHQADFFFPAVNLTHDGTYQCYSFRSSSPYEWSSPSAPLVLRVTGEAAPAPPSPPTLPSSCSGPDPEEPRDQEELEKGMPRERGWTVWSRIILIESRQSPCALPLLNHPAMAKTMGAGGSASPISGFPNIEESSPSLETENRPSGILVGISAFLALTFLFLSLLCLHHSCCQSRLGKEDRETEVKTIRRFDSDGATLEEAPYAAENDDRQTVEAGQEDTAALQREDPQEVTYVQLAHKSLKCVSDPPPQPSPVEPSVYAALQ
ncbi:leukocyte immunoglobulin-like receptor subfamily A member 2 [Gracilinanus agilis]|uniref:leukocyte immunoglobulin-like receptor subfamily A member 2 n=1 Tax=Gracilinanus agilis TaxID=191870 RepID=UPI001CFDCC49|nr:leukocyte immunoglobulin-like receptor subfamily A member 2 [Gracilinanus agilis]